MQKYIGAVFFDLDGTLLDNSSDTVPESAKEGIRRLKENGFLVVLSTGRNMSTHYSRKYLDEVDADAVIHSNGSKITVGDKTLFIHYMDEELLKKILDYAAEEGLCAGTSIGNEDYYLYPELKMKADLKWNKHITRNFRPVNELFEKHIPVIALSFAGVNTYDIKDRVEGKFPGLTLFPFNGGTGADVVEKGFSKADGMKKICELYGISLKNTWAFGDSPNDLPMLKLAGTGVAMGNAAEEVKRMADTETDPVSENGIYNGLCRLGLI